MGTAIGFLMLPEDPRLSGETAFGAAIRALQGFTGRHMSGFEKDPYKIANLDPANPPEAVDPQVWRLAPDGARDALRLRKVEVPEEKSSDLHALAEALNASAEYVDETYRVEGDLIVASSPYNPEWHFNVFDVSGRYAELFTPIPVSQWPREREDCRDCGGSGEIPPKSYILPRALRLTAEARNAPDKPVPCRRCDSDGFREFVTAPPWDENEERILTPEEALKVLQNGTEASEPFNYIDLNGCWHYVDPIVVTDEETGDTRHESDLSGLIAALKSAPPGTVVVPFEHDGG